jgi:thioredoxin reductase (NADPH)
VKQLDCSGSPLMMNLDCGSRVMTRTVVIASGARYRRPEIPDLEQYEGRGVYYWASRIEANLCRQEDVVLVGGGNSAGQAVVFLASHATRVHLLIRGNDLGKNMSRYLVDRIGSLPNVTLHTETEITAIDGSADGISGVRWRDRRNGREETKSISRVFLFVGADPNTQWLAGCGVKVNDKGFVCTGIDLAPDEYVRSDRAQKGRHPLPLETSVSGVFAIGDVRANSTKRVAAAVGEGAAVVAQVHAWLATNQRDSTRT